MPKVEFRGYRELRRLEGEKGGEWMYPHVWLPNWRREREKILTPTYIGIQRPDGSAR